MKACRVKIKSSGSADILRVSVFLCVVWVYVLMTLGTLLPARAMAASVTDLYGAVTDLPEARANQLNQAFDQALGLVLVKVTGLPELANDAARVSLFPDAASLVQRYSMLPGNKVRADFDPAAIRAVLDRAGQPVWDANRPLVAVWLAVDAGGGQRFILGEGAMLPMSVNPQKPAEMRADIEVIADQRGLPVVFPLVDAEDMGRVSFSDLWGDFREPVVAASGRYGAEAVLIGRARSMDPVQQGIRWTLVAGDEQASWQGNLASGPAYAAEFLAQRLATYANSAGALRVLITDVADLDTYGQLNKYFQSLSIIESISITRVEGDRIEFELVVRGDVDRLRRTLNASRQLQAVTSGPVAITAVDAGRLPDLVYAWLRQP